MSETALLMDTGEANRRILSTDEYRADYHAIDGTDLLFKP